MLQRALDGETQQELDPQQSELLQQVADLAKPCRVATGDEESLGDELLKLADDLASADFSGAAEMAERARRLASGSRGDDGSSEEAEAAKLHAVRGPTAEQFATASLACFVDDKSQDITARLAPLLELFLAVDRAAADALSDQAAIELIFHAGLSAAGRARRLQTGHRLPAGRRGGRSSPDRRQQHQRSDWRRRPHRRRSPTRRRTPGPGVKRAGSGAAARR